MADLLRLERDDPTFVEDLIESDRHVRIVAEWLRGRGYTVRVHPLTIRPDVRQIAEYTDNGDLEVSNGIFTWRVDVKHRPGLSFTSKETFPFPSVIVGNCHKWESAGALDASITLNADCTGILVIHPDTRPLWAKRRFFDRKRNRRRCVMLCPVDLAQFYPVNGGGDG